MTFIIATEGVSYCELINNLLTQKIQNFLLNPVCNKKKQDFHDDIIIYCQKWYMSIHLSRLILYCQYSTCTKCHVKWTNIFWDTACFFHCDPTSRHPPALRFSKVPSGERVKDFDYPELYVVKILKIHQLNIIKIINKDYEKCSRKISKSFEIRKRKKATMWSWARQKSTRKWKRKAWWV